MGVGMARWPKIPCAGMATCTIFRPTSLLQGLANGDSIRLVGNRAYTTPLRILDGGIAQRHVVCCEHAHPQVYRTTRAIVTPLGLGLLAGFISWAGRIFFAVSQTAIIAVMEGKTGNISGDSVINYSPVAGKWKRVVEWPGACLNCLSDLSCLPVVLSRCMKSRDTKATKIGVNQISWWYATRTAVGRWPLIRISRVTIPALPVPVLIPGDFAWMWHKGEKDSHDKCSNGNRPQHLDWCPT